MKYLPRAIQDSIKGGYDDEHIESIVCNNTYAHYLMDPEFWKCLGKELMWQGEWKDKARTAMIEPRWCYEFHRFIDHLASGGTYETYFKQMYE